MIFLSIDYFPAIRVYRHESGWVETVVHLVNDDHAQDVPQQQVERLSGRRAKVVAVHGAHDVRVTVDVPQELVEQPKEAPETREHGPREPVVVLFQLTLDPLQDRLYEVADGDDQRSERNRSQVVPVEMRKNLSSSIQYYTLLHETVCPMNRGEGGGFEFYTALLS